MVDCTGVAGVYTRVDGVATPLRLVDATVLSPYNSAGKSWRTSELVGTYVWNVDEPKVYGSPYGTHPCGT